MINWNKNLAVHFGTVTHLRRIQGAYGQNKYTCNVTATNPSRGKKKSWRSIQPTTWHLICAHSRVMMSLCTWQRQRSSDNDSGVTAWRMLAGRCRPVLTQLDLHLVNDRWRRPPCLLGKPPHLLHSVQVTHSDCTEFTEVWRRAHGPGCTGRMLR